MSSVAERDAQILNILNDLYDNAANPQTTVDETAYGRSMDKLFDTTAWGFREILLVVVVAMKLDRAYRASTGLYDCSPRSIYEGPIKEFLIQKGIPHRKSGPLNVAKATVGLDMTWAAQRRPSDVAVEVVHLVNYIEDDCSRDQERVDNVGISLIRRLIDQANRLEALSVNIEPSTDPDFLFHLCYELVTKAPDSGNTPQRIAAFLLKEYHFYMHTGVCVSGGDDRASVTSTTSKKPGDINEENPAGYILKVYEITVKPFDLARIRDSYDCVRIYNEENHTEIKEIIVICRREDCPKGMSFSGLHGYLGNIAYQDVMYYYWDIFEWMANTLQRMTSDGRFVFYHELNNYISEVNTAENVKQLWKCLHDELEVEV